MGLGLLINEIIVFGGVLVVGISLANLYASLYAEKQLRIISQSNPPAPESQSVKAPVGDEAKECPYCKKRIPVTDKFCGECGKDLKQH